MTLRSGGRIGRKSFSARAGKTKTVAVKLNRKGRRAVLRRNRLRVQALVRARPRGVSGARARSRTSRRTITIREP